MDCEHKRFQERLERKIRRIEEALQSVMTVSYPEDIYNAMAYSVQAGGKRVRPVLLLACCEAAGGSQGDALPFACAIELIHTYSLIHDDLPALDNDDFRRGRPSSHKAFGEAMAILAGDGLLNLAYELMSGACEVGMTVHAVKAMRIIAEAAGTRGMIGGQVADILSENTVISAETLRYIHEHKTAALFQAAMTAGAYTGGAPDSMARRFAEIGMMLGTAFQIKDDLLDGTASEKLLGKPVHSDERNRKVTYVSMFGPEKANADYLALTREAIGMLREMGDPFLTEYAESLTDRAK